MKDDTLLFVGLGAAALLFLNKPVNKIADSVGGVAAGLADVAGGTGTAFRGLGEGINIAGKESGNFIGRSLTEGGDIIESSSNFVTSILDSLTEFVEYRPAQKPLPEANLNTANSSSLRRGSAGIVTELSLAGSEAAAAKLRLQVLEKRLPSETAARIVQQEISAGQIKPINSVSNVSNSIRRGVSSQVANMTVQTGSQKVSLKSAAPARITSIGKDAAGKAAAFYASRPASASKIRR